MQVIRTESASSFYESFSDLIFCTLVLFILLFLVLALSVDRQVKAVPQEAPPNQPAAPVIDITQLQDELRQTKRELEQTKIRLSVLQQGEAVEEQLDLRQQQDELSVQKQQLSQLLGSNRFVGRSGRSLIHVAVNIRPAGGWKYVPYPPQLQNDFEVRRNGETNDEQRLREMLARSEMRTLARQSRSYSAHELQQMLTAGLQRYRTKDGNAGSVHLQIAGAFTSLLSGARNVKGEAVDQTMIARLISTDLFREFGNATDDDVPMGTVPVLQFQLSGQATRPLSCGGILLSCADAVHLLNAFGGRGVAVEIQPEAPDWFLNEVLKPTGYINRAPAVTIEDPLPL